MAVLAVLIVIISLCNSREMSKPGKDVYGAEAAAQTFIEQSLRAPSTAKYSQTNVAYVGDNEYLVRTVVDAQNGFGAMIRQTFLCRVRANPPLGGNNWTLVDIKAQ